MPLINIHATFIVEREEDSEEGLPERGAAKEHFVEHLKSFSTWKKALGDMKLNEIINSEVHENEEKTGFDVEVTLDVGEEGDNIKGLKKEAEEWIETWNDKAIWQEWFFVQDIDGYKFNSISSVKIDGNNNVNNNGNNMNGGKRRKTRKTRKTRKSRKSRKARRSTRRRRNSRK